MTSSQSILSDLASFFSTSSPPPSEISSKNNTNNENECIEITNDVPTPNNTPHSSPLDTTTTNMSNGLSVIEEGVSVVRHTTPSIEISQDCHGTAYDMSIIKIDYIISQPTTTASGDSWEEDQDNNNNSYNTPTSSKRREIYNYLLQSKFSKIDKRRRILLVHLFMLLVISLVLVIVIVSATSSTLSEKKSKQQKQSTSGKFIYLFLHALFCDGRVLCVCVDCCVELCKLRLLLCTSNAHFFPFFSHLCTFSCSFRS